MPTLAVARDYLFKLIGRVFTQEEFEHLCFEFGIELDDVTSEKDIFLREQAKACEGLDGQSVEGAARMGKKQLKETIANLSEDVIYKIDTPANRHDLLCAEGMAIALKVFLGMQPPVMKLRNASAPLYRVVVDRSVKSVREFIICAVLRNIKFDTASYNSFIDFQDKLHSGLARRRTLASVGTHDLDKVMAGLPTNSKRTPLEMHYKALEKEKISFVPLGQVGRVLNCAGDGLEEYYKNDRHIGKFCPLISSFPRYPVVLDPQGTVMSLPPIINSDFSKIDMNTRNVFVECTAPDYHKASTLVNQLICAFSSHCDEPFEVDAVEVAYPEGCVVPTTNSNVDICPNLSIRKMMLDVRTVNSRVGINITAERCAELLRKMYLYADVVDSSQVLVHITPVRSDILDQCDLIEDVAIAYGYDNIALEPAPTFSVGKQSAVNKLTHLLRIEVANAGFLEMLNFSLCSRDDAFKNLGREDKDVAVHISNPQTVEFQVCRPSLLPGALRTFAANKSQPLPIKLFEISDVVLLGDAEGNDYSKVGARNRRHFCALQCAADSASLEDIHGLVEYILEKLGVERLEAGAQIPDCPASSEYPFAYMLREGSDGAYFPGQNMEIVLTNLESKKTTVIGTFGVIHPRTLKAFDIPFPCSYCELDIQHFV